MSQQKRPDLPGGQMQRRDMHFFWLLDGSSSMAGDKIASLNFAVPEAIPGMKSAAKKNPQVRLLVRALRFADDVQWIIEEPTPIAELTWDKDIEANGETAMGRAIETVVDELDRLGFSRKLFPPVIILVTDGYATDGRVEDQLQRLLAHPIGKHSTRFAVAIGSDADKDLLKTFIGNDEIPVLEAKDADTLADHIQFASTYAIKMSSGLMRDVAINEIAAARVEGASVVKW